MSLLKAVEDALETQKRSISWLASGLNRTPEGFKLSLKNETIKFSDFKKMISLLNVPIQYYFEAGSTVQSISGKHNTQMVHSNLLGEPEVKYQKIEVEGLRKQVEILERQLLDKDEIIKLLKQ